MAYANPSDRRDKRHKVSLNSTLNRIVTRSAARAQKQNATFLLELIEWAVENGAIDEIIGTDRSDGGESSAA